MSDGRPAEPVPTPLRKPRVGFLGVGWIGRHRMQAMLQTGVIEAVAYLDPSDDVATVLADLAPAAERSPSYDAMLDLDLDAVVIATPSAGHAAQAIAGLERGAAVFCQKPLGRDEAEVRAVIAAARSADRLLAVDLSYRFTEGARRIRELVQTGELGRVHAVDLVFHNAYGPDKPWFYDREQSGGGCVMDLGVHLIDLALWILEGASVATVTANLFAGGEPLRLADDRTEDFAVATLIFDTGTVVRLACSWRLHAGRDAVISAAFYGGIGGAELRNVDGSFYAFCAEKFDGTSRTTLTAPPDDWNGRAATDFAARLAAGERFDPSIVRLGDVSQAIDRIYRDSAATLATSDVRIRPIHSRP